MRIKKINWDSNGEIYTITNVPSDYAEKRLDMLFEEMRNNYTKCAHSYINGEIDTTKKAVGKEYKNAYRVSYAYDRFQQFKTSEPFEWCIVESDEILTYEQLKDLTMKDFTRLKGKMENGKVKMVVKALKLGG